MILCVLKTAMAELKGNSMTTKRIIEQSGIAFGTSGARGLVTDFTPQVCSAFALAFVESIKSEFNFSTLAVAIDNRPSSYAMAQAISAGLKHVGIKVEYHGVIPTPALAYYAMQQGIPCIMVTGSHIPFDRNGLKFYRPDGEISKNDEKAIIDCDHLVYPIETLEPLTVNAAAKESYVNRYVDLFNNSVLAGKKIGIYEHSSAGRDIYREIFEQLGAEVLSLGRSEEFVPIDTEAVCEEDKARARNWLKEHNLDAVFSTDGDGDRPLLTDETGEWLRGDILGLLCAHALNIKALAVPVSCNTAIEQSNYFQAVRRTKIGSPYVIEEFESLQANHSALAGFEANGGFLLASDIQVNDKLLKALPTRDAVLPAVAVLAQYNSISDELAKLPKRYTASDRLKNFSREKSNTLIVGIKNDPAHWLKLLGLTGKLIDVNEIDGLRMTFDEGLIVHLRPSGNAPELRCYVESNSVSVARDIVEIILFYCTQSTTLFRA